MAKTPKISLFIVKISLAHLLIACHQPKFNNQKHNYENETDLCLVPTQEQSILKYLCLYHKYICTHDKRVFFRTFSAASWISVIYILYSTREEIKYWRKIDSKWQECLHKLNINQ